jgi:hypothetical protein
MRAFARMPEGRRDFYLYSLLREEWVDSRPTPEGPATG